jgi:hypothetical protein
MKPLIPLTLILTAAVCVQAQTIADAARKERERQAQVQSTKVITTADVKKDSGSASATPSTPSESKPVENLVPGKPPRNAAETNEAADAKAAEPNADATQKWIEQTTKLRTHIRDLENQETAAKLEINDSSSKLNAPVTSQSAKDEAAKSLEAAQKKLVAIQSEISGTNRSLQDLELQGPPKKQ